MDSGRGLSPKSGEWNSYAGLPFIVQNNGSFFNDTLTATSGYINSPASVAAMNWLGELFHKYHYTHVEDLSADFPENFAMSITKSYSIPLVSAFRLLRKMPGAGMSF